MRTIPGVVLMFWLQLVIAGSAQDASVADLLGTWDDVTPERKQDRVGYSAVSTRVPLTFDGTVCTWGERGGRAIRQSLFIPVQAGSKRGIDFVTVSSVAFWTTRALFKIEGDTLTIKEGALDRPRPTDFVPWEFDGQNTDEIASVHIYKRRAR